MRKHLLSAGMFLAIAGYSQSNVIDVDKHTGRLPAREFYNSGGFPLSSAKYIKVNSGTPYLKDYWMKGALATFDSIEYGNIHLKLDLVENSIAYKNDKGEEMICTTPVSKIMMRDSVTGKNYLFILGSFIPGADTKIWYEVLTSGKATLYKQHFKDIAETKPYGSSITEQTIRSSERYFVDVNGTFKRVKKPKEIAEVLPDKVRETSDYIDKQKFNGKKESDYVSAVEYYNSL